jgi:hypothetical protein
MSPVFVITEPSGYLGNRLGLFAQFIAAASAHNARVWNPAFFDYRRHFKTTSSDFFCTFPPKTRLSAASPRASATYLRAAQRLARVFAGALSNRRVFTVEFPAQDTSHLEFRYMFSLDDPQFVARLNKHRPMIFFSGYYFHDRTNVPAYQSTIRRYFTPLDSYQENVNRVVERARRNGDILVGVHVRRGDNNVWMGGRYYWNDDQWLAVLTRTIDAFPGKKVSFLLTSDEPLSRETFSRVNATISTGHIIEDLYALAACDYIVAPHSTYSGWASYIGEVPLLCLRAPDTEIDPAGFKIIREPYRDLSANLGLRNIDITHAVLRDGRNALQGDFPHVDPRPGNTQTPGRKE